MIRNAEAAKHAEQDFSAILASSAFDF